MKPLPKWVAWASLLVSGGLTGAGFLDKLPGHWAIGGLFVTGALKALSHSLTGTGGSPENP